MATFTDTANFTSISNCTVADGSVTVNDLASRAHRLEEADGTTLTDTGLVAINGTRDANLARVAGPFAGTYATKGDGVHICSTSSSAAWRNYWTVEFRIKFTSAELSGSNALFGRYITGNTMLSTWCDSGKLWLYCVGSSVINTGTASAVIAADTWHHVRYTYGSAGAGQGTATISVDGVQALSVAGVGQLVAPTGDIGIFAVNVITPASVFRGTMADFRFYDSQKPATYTPPTEYYRNYGDVLIHDASATLQDAGSGLAWDNSTAARTVTGSPTVKFQYADYATDQSFADAAAVEAEASWNGSWLTLAELQAVSGTNCRYRYLKSRITPTTAGDSFDDYSCDTYATDTTPPDVPTTTKFSLFETDNYAMIWVEPDDADFSHCELRRDVDGTTYYLTKNGYGLPEWATSGTFLTFADADSFSDLSVSNFIDEDISGDSISYYVRSVDETGNASAWTLFTAGEGPDAPDAPVLSVTDNGNGSGAMATVSGSDTGTTNTVYTALVGATSWTAKAVISGDGSDALSLTIGQYWAKVESAGSGGVTTGNVVNFWVTDGGVSLREIRTYLRGRLAGDSALAALLASDNSVRAAGAVLPDDAPCVIYALDADCGEVYETTGALTIKAEFTSYSLDGETLDLIDDALIRLLDNHTFSTPVWECRRCARVGYSPRETPPGDFSAKTVARTVFYEFNIFRK
jgi:hypothetical protein